MKIIKKKVSELKVYKNNPRSNFNAVDDVANSIKNFGFKVPIIIDKNNEIIAGHTRYEASLKLGLEDVPCIVADDLDEKQIKAFRIADNKVSELSEWDYSKLQKELLTLSVTDFTGFSIEEFNEIISDDGMTEEEVKAENNKIEEMELKAFEHYDYIVFLFDNTHDWQYILEKFDIKKVDGSFSKKSKKIGFGRVINGKKLVERI